MAKRKDGIEKKEHILEAATMVFSEKGYRSTTVADICSRADANIASVNYYFGTKEELYAEVWSSAFQKAMEKYPYCGHLSPGACAEERLRAFVRSLLMRFMDMTELGCAGQILIREMVHPTEALFLIKKDALTPTRAYLKGIIKELLGLEEDHEIVAFSAMSVIHQCVGYGMRKDKLPPLLKRLKESDPELFMAKLVEHISLFSVAGITAVKEML